jgi:hypothetical protein
LYSPIFFHLKKNTIRKIETGRVLVSKTTARAGGGGAAVFVFQAVFDGVGRLPGVSDGPLVVFQAVSDRSPDVLGVSDGPLAVGLPDGG